MSEQKTTAQRVLQEVRRRLLASATTLGADGRLHGCKEVEVIVKRFDEKFRDAERVQHRYGSGLAKLYRTCHASDLQLALLDRDFFELVEVLSLDLVLHEDVLGVLVDVTFALGKSHITKL